LNLNSSFELLNNKILKNFNHENRKVLELLYYKLSEVRSLGDYFKSDPNKIVILEKALNFGINIPNTIITDKKSELLKFKKVYKKIVSKAIGESIFFADTYSGQILNYTNNFTNQDIKKLNKEFQLSLFQEKIRKKYELRIFFLDDEFYSMAIFSQNDSKTETDFRRYNFKNPNRTVPYNLPTDIKSKLNALRLSLNLNSGSIDMAVNQRNEYIFFEINPVGQYGMTSIPCNYNIDKIISHFLLNFP